MRVHTRHGLFLFVAYFLGVFLLLQVFLGLGGGLRLLSHHPYLPLDRVATALPVVLLSALSLSIPLAMLLAFALFTREVHRHQGFLWIALVGGSGRRFLWPVLVLAATTSAFLWWYGRAHLPVVYHQVRYALGAVLEDPALLAARIAYEPGALDGFEARYATAASDGMLDFCLTTRGSRGTSALVAARCETWTSPDRRHLHVGVRDGRLLRCGPEGRLSANLLFDRLELRLDARRLTAPSKRDLISLKYYTDEELGRLRAQLRYLLRAGHDVGERSLRRVAAVPQMRRLRLQAALLPFYFVLLGSLFLVPRGPGPSRRAVVAFVVFGILLLVQQAFLEVSVEKKGKLAQPWLALLPTMEVALAAALAVTSPLLRRR